MVVGRDTVSIQSTRKRSTGQSELLASSFAIIYLLIANRFQKNQKNSNLQSFLSQALMSAIDIALHFPTSTPRLQWPTRGKKG